MVEGCVFNQFINHYLLKMSEKITNFMFVQNKSITDAKTLFGNLSKRMELQIPIVQYHS
jgi:hypothetical protein